MRLLCNEKLIGKKFENEEAQGGGNCLSFYEEKFNVNAEMKIGEKSLQNDY